MYSLAPRKEKCRWCGKMDDVIPVRGRTESCKGCWVGVRLMVQNGTICGHDVLWSECQDLDCMAAHVMES